MDHTDFQILFIFTLCVFTDFRILNQSCVPTTPYLTVGLLVCCCFMFLGSVCSCFVKDFFVTLALVALGFPLPCWLDLTGSSRAE